MGQIRTHKTYPDQFKDEAVALVQEQGYTVPEAAKALGTNQGLLYRWKEKTRLSSKVGPWPNQNPKNSSGCAKKIAPC